VKVAISSMGTSLDAWAGGPFGLCTQFLVVEPETMEYVVISVPVDELEAGAEAHTRVSLAAIRAIAKQGAEVVLTGAIKDVCRETMETLGIEVIAEIERMTVRQAVEMYRTSGQEALARYQPQPAKIAVATHGGTLETILGGGGVSAEGEPCTSFLLVDPQTMAFEVVQVEPAEELVQASVNAVRAAARSGATVVITPEIRPACCTALRALAITVALADPGMTVREAVEKYLSGELSSPPYL
jgi:predicted Fe-Mo cluster-binding NifX family protein